jgi:hypothetical protein
MTENDLPALIDLQRAGAIVGLADVFPQDLYPFPSDVIAARWRTEINEPGIETWVALDNSERLVGFAATTGSELLHFGTAIDTWGDGTASELHDAVVGALCVRGTPTLMVFADNLRGRRFYEKHGWQPTGATTRSSYPPYAMLLEYCLPNA